MKFLKTLLSFFSLYLFVGVVVFIALLGMWLSTYVSDIPSQKIAEVTVGSSNEPTPSIQYYDVAATDALESIISRGIAQKRESKQAVLSARSTVMIATFQKVSLGEKLVPLGFKTMYRLEKVVDAKGEELYFRHESLLDQLFRFVLNNRVKFEKQYITLLATDREQSYTLNVQENELMVKTANEN